MAKKPSNSAEKLKEISDALKREIQLENWQKELLDKKMIIEKQLAKAKIGLQEVKSVLDKDPALTTVARQMITVALELQGKVEDLKVYNPNYVTTNDKVKLLDKILTDYKAENPKSKSMSFSDIKNVLKNRYQVETNSAGLFFRNQIKEFETIGGNKNKAIVLE